MRCLFALCLTLSASPSLADVTPHADHKPERALSACRTVLSAETLDVITRHEAFVQSGIALRVLGRFYERLEQLNAALDIAPLRNCPGTRRAAPLPGRSRHPVVPGTGGRDLTPLSLGGEPVTLPKRGQEAP